MKHIIKILVGVGILFIICPILLVVINHNVGYETRMKIMNSGPYFLTQLGSAPFILWMIVSTSLIGSIIIIISLFIKKAISK